MKDLKRRSRPPERHNMKRLIYALLIVVAGCKMTTHEPNNGACWFPPSRSATTGDLVRIKAIVASLRQHPIAFRQITGYEKTPPTTGQQATNSLTELPLPPAPLWTNYTLAVSDTNAIIDALLHVRAPTEQEAFGFGYNRETYFYIGDDLGYGEVLVLRAWAGDKMFAYMQTKMNFPEEADITVVAPGIGQVIRRIVGPTCVPSIIPNDPSTREGPKDSRLQQNATFYVIQPGDTLWSIAHQRLGTGKEWLSIMDLNKDKIKRADRLPIGVRLSIPKHNAGNDEVEPAAPLFASPAPR